MTFRIRIKRSVEKDISKLSKDYANKIFNVLESLRLNALPYEKYNISKLKGYDDVYRIKIGRIRIVYEVNFDDRCVTIIGIDFRGRIYKKIKNLKK